MVTDKNSELEKFRLNFSVCANRDVALFNGNVIGTVKKQTNKTNQKREIALTEDKTKTGFCRFVINVTLCHLTGTRCGV